MSEKTIAATLIDKIFDVTKSQGNHDNEEIPTQYAALRASSLIFGVARDVKHMAEVIPLEAGLWLSWIIGNRQLRLFCGCTPRDSEYIYTAMVANGRIVESKLEKDVNVFNLATAIRWVDQA